MYGGIYVWRDVCMEGYMYGSIDVWMDRCVDDIIMILVVLSLKKQMKSYLCLFCV